MQKDPHHSEISVAETDHDHHNQHHHHGSDQHKHSGAGHHGHVEKFRRLFWVMLAISLPVIASSEMFSMILGYEIPEALWIEFLGPILGSIMYFWGGSPFLSGAISELKIRKPGMMLLISLAITVAYTVSMGASLGFAPANLDFWWELALLIVIMLLGHWIEMRSLAATGSALESLAALLPDEAEVLQGEEIKVVSPSELRVGDIVIIRPGGRVPADGVIVSGEASMDESMISGESQTLNRGQGETVVGGSIATDSSIQVKITAVGEETALAGIQKLVKEAQESSSKAQRLADRAAALLFWFALGAALITASVWLALGQNDQAVIRTITVLVIACPHALGLAIPLVVSISTERAAKAGVLIKDRLALEKMRSVQAVLFDKTGTLTRGEPVVTDVLAVDGQNPEQLIAYAAAAESESEHPLAKAILSKRDEMGQSKLNYKEFRSSPAEGVQAIVEEKLVRVGGPLMISNLGQSELAEVQDWKDEGAIILHVAIEEKIVGALKLSDAIREESYLAVRSLQQKGTKVVMITGDAEAVANSVAKQLGIDRVFASVKPENKEEKVRQLQAEGLSVAMVGDGVNDAPALARADVGIAIGAGTDVAIASAGVILASSDPRSVLSVFELSEKSFTKMKQNLWWAAGYNLLSVPLAAGVLAPIGFVLPVSVGAFLMSMSTIVVALNAQLLRRMDLNPELVT